MRASISVCLVAVMFVASLPATAGERETRLREGGATLLAEVAEHLKAGRREMALELIGGAIVVYRRIPDLVAAANGVARLADCLRAMGKEEAALVEERRALMLHLEARAGADHPDVARQLVRRGVGAGKLSLDAESRKALEEAVAMYDRMGTGDHPDHVHALQQLADRHYFAGRMKEAIPVYEAGVAMRDRLGSEDSASHAYHRFQLGVCYWWAARYEDSLGPYDAAREMFVRLGDEMGVAICLSSIGLSLGALGRSAEALPLHEQALETKRRRAPNDLVGIAISQNNLALCLWNLGRSEDALARFRKVLDLQRKVQGEVHESIALALSNIAGCLVDLGRADEALEKYESALEMRIRLFGRHHLSVAASLSGVAHCLQDLGRYEEARRRFAEAGTIQAALYGADHRAIVLSKNSEAQCLVHLGRPAEALLVYEDALAMARRLFREHHPVVLLCMSCKASCLRRLGRPEEALVLRRRVLGTREKHHAGDHPDLAAAHADIASCLADLGRHQEALPIYREALEMVRRLYPRDHPRTATSLNDLGSQLLNLGRPSEALPFLRDALAMYRRLYPGDHSTVATSHNNVAVALSRLDREKEAAEHYGKAVEIARRLGSAKAYRWITNLGRLLLKQGRAEEAAGLFGEAIAQIEALRVAAVELPEHERGRYFRKLKEYGAYEKMVDAQLALGRAREAIRYAEQGRARSLLDLLERSRFDPLGEARRRAEEQGDRELIDAIAALETELERCSLETGRLTHAIHATRGRRDLSGDAKWKAIRGLSVELARIRGERGDAMRRRAGFVRDHLPATSPATPEAMQRLLSGGRRLLLYSIGDRASHVFVVPPPGGKVRALTLAWPDGKPIGSEALAREVIAYVDAIGKEGRAKRDPSRREPPASAALGHRLFRALVPVDLWKEIKEAGLVYLVPHGPLHRLPFESLVAREPPKSGALIFWLDEGPSIAYGNSGSTLLWSRRHRDRQARSAKGRVALLLGDPIFSPEAAPLADAAPTERGGQLSRFGRLVPLPGTRREALAIRDILLGRETEPPWQVEVLLGADATRTRLRALAPRARYLHLATHLLADETTEASYSSLALTLPPVPSAEDDGFLKLIDLLEGWRDRISRCEMVVLSACESRRGLMQRDEGVFAMPWGFFFAGAPSVVASLWRVEDQSTADLMSDFYRRLASEDAGGKLRSFNEARKALRKARPAPFFWAPFVYIGDPR